MLRSVAFAAALVVAPTAMADPTKEWGGAGLYCVVGASIVAPDGYEARSFFGYDLVLRKAGVATDAETVQLDPIYLTIGGSESDAALIPNPGRERVDCNDGAPAETIEARRDAPNVEALGVFTQRCVGAAGSYGIIDARARFVQDGRTRVFDARIAFGGESFFDGRLRYEAETLVREEEALRVLDAIVSGLGACAAP